MSLSNYVRRTKGEDREDINRLLGVMSDIFYPEPEEGSVQERIILAEERRIRTLSVTDAILDVTTTDTRNRHAVEAARLQMPTVCESYPHTHTTNGSLVQEKTTNTKYGGGSIFDGSSDYITIDHIASSDLDLEITDAFSIAFWMKNTVSSFHGIFGKRAGFVAGNSGYHVSIEFQGDIRWHFDNGTTRYQVASSQGFDDGVYHSVVCTYDGNSNTNGMKIYIDGSLDATGSSLAITGSIKNTNPLAIGAFSAGAEKYPGSLAWSMILKEEVSAAWVTGFHNGFFDWSGGNLVTSIPFVGDETLWAEATTPFCVSS